MHGGGPCPPPGSPGGGARTWGPLEHDLSPAAQRRDEVDFAGLLHLLIKALGGDIAVHSDGDMRAHFSAGAEALLDTRIAGIQVVDNLLHRGARNNHLLLAAGERLQQSRNPHHRHGYLPAASISIVTRPG